MELESLEKQIIILDSNNAIYNISSNIHDYYIDILTPIKDAMYIKLLNTHILLNNSYLNDANTTNNDNIFIFLNNYNRILTNTVSNTSNITLYNYFDNVIINKSDFMVSEILYNQWNKPNILSSNINFTYNNINENNSSESLYRLNPIEPNLRRFNMRIYNSIGTVLDKTYITRVITKICVYYNRKKLTMS